MNISAIRSDPTCPLAYAVGVKSEHNGSDETDYTDSVPMWTLCGITQRESCTTSEFLYGNAKGPCVHEKQQDNYFPFNEGYTSSNLPENHMYQPLHCLFEPKDTSERQPNVRAKDTCVGKGNCITGEIREDHIVSATGAFGTQFIERDSEIVIMTPSHFNTHSIDISIQCCAISMTWESNRKGSSASTISMYTPNQGRLSSKFTAVHEEHWTTIIVQKLDEDKLN